MAIRAEEIDGTLGAVDIDRDRRLVLRHQTGDLGAFDELYRRYHDRLVAFCLRRVGDRHTAEELAQEAFVKAFRAMPTFAGERRFYPWMTVIAHRLCIDHHRRSARVEPAAEVDPGTVDPDHDALFASVDHDHVAAAFERLAPRHREILDLREHRGWSYQAIADHLDVPMTTVEALLHRARKALRREYLAVSGEGRVGRLGVAAFGGGLLARLKRWLAATGADRWGPAVGTTAAAGTLAIGLVAGPLTGGGVGDGGLLVPPPTPAAAADAGTTTVAPAAPVVTAAPPGAGTAAGAASSAGARPEPSADLGPVSVYSGEEATTWAEEQNDQQPVQVGLGEVADVGLDPVQIIADLLDPADNSPNPTGGAP